MPVRRALAYARDEVQDWVEKTTLLTRFPTLGGVFVRDPEYEEHRAASPVYTLYILRVDLLTSRVNVFDACARK